MHRNIYRVQDKTISIQMRNISLPVLDRVCAKNDKQFVSRWKINQASMRVGERFQNILRVLFLGDL